MPRRPGRRRCGQRIRFAGISEKPGEKRPAGICRFSADYQKQSAADDSDASDPFGICPIAGPCAGAVDYGGLPGRAGERFLSSPSGAGRYRPPSGGGPGKTSLAAGSSQLLWRLFHCCVGSIAAGRFFFSPAAFHSSILRLVYGYQPVSGSFPSDG